MPCNLSEESLLQIAADLRTVELLRANDDDRNPPIVRPLYLLSRLMVAEAKKIAADSECAIPLERLDHWMKRLQHFIEREIVSREIEMPCEADTDELLAEIQEECLVDW